MGFLSLVLCHAACMKRILVPMMLLPALALVGCSSDDQSEAGVERGAAAAGQLTLCVQNDSTKSISSSGDGSASGPEGFLVRPGERACTSTSGSQEVLKQNMMSDEGPAWATQLTSTEDGSSSGVSVFTWSFSTCGKTWRNEEEFSASVSCSGNPFNVSGTINFDNGGGSTANVTFADQ